MCAFAASQGISVSHVQYGHGTVSSDVCFSRRQLESRPFLFCGVFAWAVAAGQFESSDATFAVDVLAPLRDIFLDETCWRPVRHHRAVVTRNMALVLWRVRTVAVLLKRRLHR